MLTKFNVTSLRKQNITTLDIAVDPRILMQVNQPLFTNMRCGREKELGSVSRRFPKSKTGPITVQTFNASLIIKPMCSSFNGRFKAAKKNKTPLISQSQQLTNTALSEKQ
jgi:hypothetical protein